MDHHGLPNGKEKNPTANAGDMVGHVSGHHPWLQTQVVCHNPADQMDSSFARLFYLTIFFIVVGGIPTPLKNDGVRQWEG